MKMILFWFIALPDRQSCFSGEIQHNDYAMFMSNN